ncbi:hypothetical protein QBC39DRAFT_384610 [Podospora conica]|nr:hypothetical protein QBC39DRAFT_384610 [Schizothecium conicum]
MKTLSLVSLVGISLQAVTAATLPQVAPRAACTSPKVRKEWSQATRAEQTSYIKAALCLATKPSRIGLESTLYDDFGWVHADLFSLIHDQASFFPWHRYFLDVYEKALHECGYTGTMMYWNWTADSANPPAAKVFDPVTGFGGNGSSTTCVVDGPFKDLKPAYWNSVPRSNFPWIPTCLTRVWAPGSPGVAAMNGDRYAPDVMRGIAAIDDFDVFRRDLEGGPHSAVHGGVGGNDGDMGFQTASPNDPLFFLHHANVDRLWWDWQQKDPKNRTFTYYGPKQDGQGTPSTLDDVMPMGKLAPDVKVREYMDTQGDNLCYVY